jgi:hypothetical protein
MTKWRWNFRKFIRFFKKGLNPSKIQGIFKFEFVPEIVTWNPDWIWSCSKKKVAPCVSKYLYAKFGEFWTSGRSLIWISNFGRLKILKKSEKCRGPLVILSGCLNGSHQSPMSARMTPRAVTWWWPYATGGHRPTCATCRYPHVEPLSQAKVAFSSLSARPCSHHALCFPHPSRLLVAPLPAATSCLPRATTSSTTVVLHESSRGEMRTKTILRHSTPTSVVPHRWQPTSSHP